MGKQDLVDKGIKALVDPSGYPLKDIGNGIAKLDIGLFKSQLAYFDLDVLSNQPAINAERQNILGVLDGRLEGYDLKTLAIAAATPLGAVLVTAQLTVPATSVFYVTDVQIVDAGDAAATFALNWRCSLWPDQAATPSQYGQAFYATDQAKALGQTIDALFGVDPTAGSENKPVVLRLGPGAVITLQVTVTVAAVKAATTVALKLFGYVGKLLVK
jgi:hypothetical protein